MKTKCFAIQKSSFSILTSGFENGSLNLEVLKWKFEV